MRFRQEGRTASNRRVRHPILDRPSLDRPGTSQVRGSAVGTPNMAPGSPGVSMGNARANPERQDCGGGTTIAYDLGRLEQQCQHCDGMLRLKARRRGLAAWRLVRSHVMAGLLPAISACMAPHVLPRCHATVLPNLHSGMPPDPVAFPPWRRGIGCTPGWRSSTKQTELNRGRRPMEIGT